MAGTYYAEATLNVHVRSSNLTANSSAMFHKLTEAILQVRGAEHASTLVHVGRIYSNP